MASRVASTPETVGCKSLFSFHFTMQPTDASSCSLMYICMPTARGDSNYINHIYSLTDASQSCGRIKSQAHSDDVSVRIEPPTRQASETPASARKPSQAPTAL